MIYYDLQLTSSNKWKLVYIIIKNKSIIIKFWFPTFFFQKFCLEKKISKSKINIKNLMSSGEVCKISLSNFVFVIVKSTFYFDL